MPDRADHELSRRERQIMDAIHARGQASVAEVREALPDPPSYSAVRALLNILEQKGFLKHREIGPRYVYFAAQARASAARGALKRVLQTFFDGSPEKAVAALLDVSDAKLSSEAWDRLAALIDQARQKGRSR
jgi:predicted transcriptional regulator